MKFNRFYLPNQDSGVESMLLRRGGKIVDNEFDAECIVFTGGEDVHPFFYGEKLLPTTHCNLTRDLKEIRLIKNIPKDFPKIGICRGAQLLNVTSGGSLFQFVNNHCRLHPIWDYYNNDMIAEVTSTHKQMMRPTKDAVILGVGWESNIFKTDLFTYHPNTTKTIITDPMVFTSDDGDDVEIVLYPKDNCLCFQPHPEYKPNSEMEDLFFDLIDNYIQDGHPPISAELESVAPTKEK